MNAGACLLDSVLQSPAHASALSLPEWETVILQARTSRLIGRLAHELLSAGLAEAVPAQVWRHLASADQLVKEQHRSLDYELEMLRDTLRALDIPVVLLKGGAYVLRGLNAGHGRTFSDIDILVPQSHLAQVEAALMLEGWVSEHRDAYDQRYYRQWMHEIPPMTHIRRGTTLDVHHALTPSTSRIRADSARMLESAQHVPGYEPFMTLSPADLVLHSATHLFLESELHSGLRDLFDLAALFADFRRGDPNFDRVVAKRALEVGLERTLFYAVRYLNRLLGLEFEPGVLALIKSKGPAWPLLPLMDALFRRALAPRHESCADTLTPLALFLLYVRGHWLRMPLPLLLWHLSRKAIVTRLEKNDNDEHNKHATNA